jgi:hypothetical protein
MYRDILVVMFATAAGFTASGIIANLYRLLATKPKSMQAQAAYVAVMVVAGPNVLLGNATNSFRTKGCSKFAFWLAAAIAAYWSFVLGLFLLDVVVSV